jgi:hypothetical protein
VNRQFVRRKSCPGTLIRLSICDGYSLLHIEKGRSRQRIEIADANIEDVLAKFEAIEDADSFAAFVNEMSPGVKA